MTTANDPPFVVPLLVSSPPRFASLSVVGRLLNLLIAAGCLTVLILALRVRPSESGMGTHVHLGMSSCAWLERTRLPCPSCGMTTSFAWFARGNLLASAYVQPAGFVGAVVTTIVFWVTLYAALTAKPVAELLHRLPAKYTWLAVLVLAMGAWGWKIFIHLQKIDGWRV